MHKILLFTLLIINPNAYGQTSTKDSIIIEIKKCKLVDNVSVLGIRQLKVKSEKLHKVMIKTKIQSLPNNKTKLSAFSLLDKKNKLRYRLADYKGYRGAIGGPELLPIRKTEFFNKKGKAIRYKPLFDKSIKDLFDDYDKEGYTNIEFPVNLGTKKKPKLSIIYFGETSYERFTAELFFAVLVENTDLNYELYYKDEKIADIKF